MHTDRQIPGKGELRKFGLLFGVFFMLVIGLLAPWIGHGFGSPSSISWPRWPWVCGLGVMAWSLAHPASLHLLYRPWMKFAEVAAWVNTRLIMLLMFYLLIMPIGLIMRLFGYDPMRRRFDPAADSYRSTCKTQESDHMRHPY